MAVVLAAFAMGLLFGAGLAVSHMMDPVYVLGFLDIAGDWNPTLLLVMAGAVAAAAPGFYLTRARRPCIALQPDDSDIGFHQLESIHRSLALLSSFD